MFSTDFAGEVNVFVKHQLSEHVYDEFLNVERF